MTESLVKEEFKDWTELFNHTYEYDGFEGVLYELEDKLEYGKIIEKENHIVGILYTMHVHYHDGISICGSNPITIIQEGDE